MADQSESSQNIEGTVSVAAGTITTGTLQNLVSGTVTSVTNLAGGTVQIAPKPTKSVLTFGTLGTGAAYTAGTVVAAGGAGTAHFVNSLSIVVTAGTVDCFIGYGTALVGAGVLTRGNFIAGGGISQQFPSAAGGNNTNAALTWAINGAGTASFNVSYWTQ